MSLAVVVVLVLTAATSAYRWTWVSQKEHYLAPAALLTATRWMKAYLVNSFVAVASFALAVAALVLGAAGHSTAGALAIPATILAALFPLGMDPRAVRLRLTRRASVQLVAGAVLTGGVAVACALGTGEVGAAGLAVVLTPFAVDAAARVLRPVELRLSRKYVEQAATKLGRVQPRVVAITGSWGKTSTKNHLADILGATHQTVASPASWNNMAGLARTVNEKLVTGTELLVLEMGTYGPGEIAAMCAWTHPEVAVICEIGPMHLERMKTMEAIVAAKAEIATAADQVVLWVENPYLESLAGQMRAGQKVWHVGRRGRPDLDVSVEEADGRIELYWGETLVGSAPLGGQVQPGNVACAAAAALAIGMSPARIGAQIATLAPPPHRAVAAASEQGVWMIDDTYNSNPAGAASALERLLGSNCEGRRVVITPGMVELGSEQPAANRQFASAIARGGVELVVVGRTNSKDLRAGFGPGAVTVADREAARKWIAGNLQPGDCVLWENDLPPHYP